jgi:hypothetical protein
MARYKQIDTSPRFLAVDLEAQLLPGTFEHGRGGVTSFDLMKSSAKNCRFT